MPAAYRRRFPGSLDGAPFHLPLDGSPIRAAPERWFGDSGLRPRITGEFDDRALLKVCAQELRERFCAIAPDRTLRHPAVVAICEAARDRLFRG